ncbi:MAG: CocE/NonD family hydrolase [Pseudomonadota bacterium]
MDVEIVQNEWIPMRDGRRLAAKLWLPKTDAPCPAILEYLPYRKRDGTAPRDVTTHDVFAPEGYACIRVDIAGTGDSDGIFDDEYSEQELSDGEAVISWIAEQPWCSGKVGMIGISWGGFNGLQLAFRRPKALKAIVTVCSTVDRFADDIHYMGGCLLTDNFNWGCQMLAYQTRPPDPVLRNDWAERWVERIETLPFMAADWMRHPTRDPFWRHGSVCEDWDSIEAATLAIGGWADAYVNAPPALATRLTAPASALMGPWDHKYPHIARINPADFHGEVLDWFGRWLKSAPTGSQALPPYRHFQQVHDAPGRKYAPAAGRWLAEPGMPSPNVSERSLRLGTNILGDQKSSGRLTVRSNLRAGQGAAYFCPGMRINNELSDDQRDDDAASSCFDTEPLKHDLELLGRASLLLLWSVDRPVAQLCARLCDVAPDGSSQRITYRTVNLNQYEGPEAAEALVPGQIYRIEVPLNECSHRLKAGHRLRLALSTSYWPIMWPGPKEADVTLDLDGCTLRLPVRAAEREIDPKPLGPPRSIVGDRSEILREASANFERREEASGELIVETFDDYGKDKNPDHGLIVGSSVHQIYAIVPGDPLSARQEATWSFEFERPGWQVFIETRSRMTASARTFHLTRSVVAWYNGEVVLEKTWSEDLPRGFS